MARLGMHLPNREFEPGELEHILALGCSDYVDLADYAGRWPEIRRRQPEARIHARVDVRGRLDHPTDDAAHLMGMIESHPEADTWRYRNEPQLESPGATPEEWESYLSIFGQALSPSARARTSAPAVSPGVDFVPWLEATLRGGQAGGFHYRDAHAYGSPDEVAQVLAEYRSRYAGPLIITETNFGAGRSYDLGLWATQLAGVLRVCSEHAAECVCEFIWAWQNPDLHLPTPVDVRGSPLEAAMASLAGEVRRAASAAATAAAVHPAEATTLAREGRSVGELERWAANVYSRAGVPFNPDAGITRYWLECARRGQYLGRPEGPEHLSEEGIPMQEFSSAVVYWKDGTAHQGLPFV